jgi:site-specific DNA-methyltransferase (adenine-specific)
VEFSSEEVAKLRKGKGGIWRIPPKLNGAERNPLPRFTVLSDSQKEDIAKFFHRWGEALLTPLVPGGHVFVASNPTLQMYAQQGMVRAGYELRACVVRLYHGFRGGDRPKNAEKDFPSVCVSPRGNYEPWLLFRKPISEKTVAQNLRKWGTGGLRMLAGNRPVPDVIPSGRTPRSEEEISDHPSLKPQHLLRILVRSLLPLGTGTILDPFMGSGSTLAAATAVGYPALGLEIDPVYYNGAVTAIPQLARVHPDFTGEDLTLPEAPDRAGSRSHAKTPSLFE